MLSNSNSNSNLFIWEKKNIYKNDLQDEVAYIHK